MKHVKNYYSFILFLFCVVGIGIILSACDQFIPNQSLTAEARNTQEYLLTERAQISTEKPMEPEINEATRAVLNTQLAAITQRTDATLTADAGVIVNKNEEISATQSAEAVQLQMAAQAEEIKAAVLWRADFETGDISQVQAKGDFLNQGSGSYSVVTQGHSGNYSVGLTIDTDAPSDTGSHAAYLFYWGEFPEAGYYSTWYYIPAGIQVQEWWSLMQWKSTYDGNSDNSVRVFALSVDQDENNMWLMLNQRPTTAETGENTILYPQKIAPIPLDRWFHVEVYYKKANDGTGQVVLWQDDVELLNIEGVNTTFSDNTLYWSVHNYTNRILPNPCTIYVDDLAIGLKQIGNTPLP